MNISLHFINNPDLCIYVNFDALTYTQELRVGATYNNNQINLPLNISFVKICEESGVDKYLNFCRFYIFGVLLFRVNIPK